MMRIALLVAAVCVVQARVIAFGIQVRSLLPESCRSLKRFAMSRSQFKVTAQQALAS